MSEIKSDKCSTCGKTAYVKERIVADMKVFHANCFKCHHCNSKLTLGKYASMEGKYFCKPHFKQLFMSKGNYNEGFGTEKHSKNWEPQVAAGAFKGVEAIVKGEDDKEGKGSRLVPPKAGGRAASPGRSASPARAPSPGREGSQGHAAPKQSKPEPFKLHVVIKEQGAEKQRLVLAC